MALIDRVAHRLKLRDLRMLDAVVQWRSMARAAAHLNLTPPAVSKAINELEHTLGVRLLDRNREGIEPTAHGRAILKRGTAIFDELRQGVSEIEYLSDPTAGEVRFAAAVPMAAGILPEIVGRLCERYPRISISAREVPVGALPFQNLQYRELRERNVDLVFGPVIRRSIEDDLETEVLFGDSLIVATGKRNPRVRRKSVKLQDLADEPWCLPPPDSRAGLRCLEAFRANGMQIHKEL